MDFKPQNIEIEPLEKFSARLNRPDLAFLHDESSIAVAVSGGPDSMALCFLLSRWATEHGAEIHALHVDHGLRPESAQEALALEQMLAGWPHLQFRALTWDGDKPRAAIQEAARNARYGLMRDYCRAHNIGALALAHHRDDQAETLLFRLAKGSGLDGLAGMAAAGDYDGLTLVRPLLEWGKDELIALCEAEAVASFNDPSNENKDYARVRLRQSRAALEEEGLTAARLAKTAQRLSRARMALEDIADKTYKSTLTDIDANRIVFQKQDLLAQPEEIILRVLIMAMEQLSPPDHYSARLERLETLLADMINAALFRRRTLGGVIFTRDDKANQIIIETE